MPPDGLQTSSGYVVFPLLGFIVLLTLAIISFLRGGWKRTNILFAAISFLAALLNADMVLISVLTDDKLALMVDRTTHFAFVFSIPIYIGFVHSFLGIQGRRWLEISALFFSIALLPIIPTDLYYAGFYEYSFGRVARAGKLFPLFSAAITFTVVYCLALLMAAMRRTTDNVQKYRIKYVFWGMGISALLLALTILPVSGIPIYPAGHFSFIPAAFLAYGVLRYDLLDIGALIRKGTVYFLLTGILTALYIVIIFLFHTLFIISGSGNSFLLSMVLAFIIVIFFNPLKEWVQGMIDRLFFRGRYNYRELLREISGGLASMLNLGQIREVLIGKIGEALQVEGEGVSLILFEAGGYRLYRVRGANRGEPAPVDIGPAMTVLKDAKRPLYRTMVEGLPLGSAERRAFVEIFAALGAAMIVPICSGEVLVGFIAIGQKRSGELFVDEDLKLLMTIAYQAATAIENAQNYEALASLNRNLERRVAERTAALRKALTEKERTQEQLVQSESLAAVGQLVAGTAHELNNPIAGAMSLVETSAEVIAGWNGEMKNRDEVLDDLRFSLGELKRAGTIIRSLLDLSRQTQTYLEAVDMNRAVDDALRVLHNQFKQMSVEIIKEFGEVPEVEGNFANLGQVLINVIRNALQALPEGKGRITLSTCHRPASNTVVVACQDSGTGIPAAVLKDVFKPFFTTKKVGQGTGLGLYISHEIVRRHGGQISVESQDGRGALVTIEIPCKRRK